MNKLKFTDILKAAADEIYGERAGELLERYAQLNNNGKDHLIGIIEEVLFKSPIHTKSMCFAENGKQQPINTQQPLQTSNSAKTLKERQNRKEKITRSTV